MGFIDFDGARYWDLREPLLMTVHNGHGYKNIPSDSRNRIDLINMKKGNIPKAQECKEVLEEQQRADHKLREEVNKQRLATGQKFIYLK